VEPIDPVFATASAVFSSPSPSVVAADAAAACASGDDAAAAGDDDDAAAAGASGNATAVFLAAGGAIASAAGLLVAVLPFFSGCGMSGIPVCSGGDVTVAVAASGAGDCEVTSRPFAVFCAVIDAFDVSSLPSATAAAPSATAAPSDESFTCFGGAPSFLVGGAPAAFFGFFGGAPSCLVGGAPAAFFGFFGAAPSCVVGGAPAAFFGVCGCSTTGWGAASSSEASRAPRYRELDLESN
jgi:hypothetical protein